MTTPPPRIFGIVATRAPIVAVLRRGPTDWCHVGRWELDPPRFVPGAWLHATLYPQKCDLSPDGRTLAVSVLDPHADWPAGTIYQAVSRLPWLHALAAWEAGTTYTRGFHFTERADELTVGKPDVGNIAPLLERYGLAITRPVQFAVERRRGWSEADDSEPRAEGDMWDERRTARMRKPRPGGAGEWELRVEGTYGAFRTIPHLRTPVVYSLRRRDHFEVLDDVQWADWDAEGRLLVATASGRLRIHDDPERTAPATFDEDLGPLTPRPVPPPEEATHW